MRHSCATLNPDQSNARSRERAQRPRVFYLTLTYMEVGKPLKCPDIRWDTLARIAQLPYRISSCEVLILRCQPEPHWAAHKHQFLV